MDTLKLSHSFDRHHFGNRKMKVFVINHQKSK